MTILRGEILCLAKDMIAGGSIAVGVKVTVSVAVIVWVTVAVIVGSAGVFVWVGVFGLGIEAVFVGV